MGKVDFQDLLGKIREKNLFGRIKRFSYLPYDMEMAMTAVLAIGKSRTPRFVIDDENVFVYENMIKWIQGDPSFSCLDPDTKAVTKGRLDAGIYIAGNTGSGKSWVLEVMSAFCLADNVQAVFGKDKRSLSWQNYRTDAICDVYASSGSVDKYKNIPILGLQDLGTDSEPLESLYMGNRLKVMRQVLEARGDDKSKLTLITSNIPMTHRMMIDRYDHRVVSRLREMCNYFELTGKDRRKAI